MNEGNQLNGVVRDIQQIWSIIDFKNSNSSERLYYAEDGKIYDESVYLNSSSTTFSNKLTAKMIKDRITGEFSFFTKQYFVNRGQCFISLFLTGHGLNGELCCNNSNLRYKDLIEHILSAAQTQASKIGPISCQDQFERNDDKF